MNSSHELISIYAINFVIKTKLWSPNPNGPIITYYSQLNKIKARRN
jgi:hypothetical protein